MSDSRGRGDPGDDAVPIRGGFDLSHLQAVHRHLFDGVDPDAGQLRTVDPPTAPGPGNPPDGGRWWRCRSGTSPLPAGRCWTCWTGPDCGAWRRARWPRCSPSCTSTCASFAPSRPAATRPSRCSWVCSPTTPATASTGPPAALTAAAGTGDPDPLRVVLQGAVHHIDPTSGTGAGRKRREVHALVDTLREVADQLRPPHGPAPPG